MATYGSGLKISAAVSASKSSTGNIYTPAAGTYAWLNWAITTSGGSATIEMGGVAFISSSGSRASSMESSGVGGNGPFIAGPSQAINTTITGTAVAYVVGVLFTNG